jgi:uncharacterized protein (DUF4213/DUF364 family)
VGVIGHFPRLESLAWVAAEMFIFERIPQPGDYPDSAAEYLIPTCDVLIITGTSVINKTAPRLLELAQGLEIYLVGPSVPLCRDLG